MKAIAVYPGKPGSAHLEEMPRPGVDEVPDGRGVLVKVLRVGVDGTDKEINAAEYGAAPQGFDFLDVGGPIAVRIAIFDGGKGGIRLAGIQVCLPIGVHRHAVRGMAQVTVADPGISNRRIVG